jgi:hypothetical protein
MLLRLSVDYKCSFQFLPYKLWFSGEAAELSLDFTVWIVRICDRQTQNIRPAIDFQHPALLLNI